MPTHNEAKQMYQIISRKPFHITPDELTFVKQNNQLYDQIKYVKKIVQILFIVDIYKLSITLTDHLIPF